MLLSYWILKILSLYRLVVTQTHSLNRWLWWLLVTHMIKSWKAGGNMNMNHDWRGLIMLTIINVLIKKIYIKIQMLGTCFINAAICSSSNQHLYIRNNYRCQNSLCLIFSNKKIYKIYSLNFCLCQAVCDKKNMR